jgi:hypothetical protein
VPARRVRIEIDADKAIVAYAAVDLGNAGLRRHARGLRKHRYARKTVGKEARDAMDEFVTDTRPGRAHLKIANVMRHKTRARRKNRQVRASRAHFRELIAFDRLAQLVVADLELGD